MYNFDLGKPWQVCKRQAGHILSYHLVPPTNVGLYAGGRFSSNVPMRVIQPLTHPNNSIDMKSEGQSYPVIKHECHERKRRRQAIVPAVTTSYEVKAGAWNGNMRVTVCWRELLFNDDSGGHWVEDNLIF